MTVLVVSKKEQADRTMAPFRRLIKGLLEMLDATQPSYLYRISAGILITDPSCDINYLMNYYFALLGKCHLRG